MTLGAAEELRRHWWACLSLEAGGVRRLALGVFGTRLRFDRCLIEQHHGEAVADRVDSVASRALETLRILTVFQRLDAGRADQVFQQIFRKHDWALYDSEEKGL